MSSLPRTTISLSFSSRARTRISERSFSVDSPVLFTPSEEITAAPRMITNIQNTPSRRVLNALLFGFFGVMGFFDSAMF